MGEGEGYQCVKGLGYQWEMVQAIIERGGRLSVKKWSGYLWERGQGVSERGGRLLV